MNLLVFTVLISMNSRKIDQWKKFGCAELKIVLQIYNSPQNWFDENKSNTWKKRKAKLNKMMSCCFHFHRFNWFSSHQFGWIHSMLHFFLNSLIFSIRLFALESYSQDEICRSRCDADTFKLYVIVNRVIRNFASVLSDGPRHAYTWETHQTVHCFFSVHQIDLCNFVYHRNQLQPIIILSHV